MNNVEKITIDTKSAEGKGIKNFVEKNYCKITVLKLDFNSELYNQYPYGLASPCG